MLLTLHRLTEMLTSVLFWALDGVVACKLVDLGVAVFMDENQRAIRGTVCYVAMKHGTPSWTEAQDINDAGSV